MNRIMFRGIMPALITPVNGDGSLREEVTRQLVRDLSATGITGFYILGSTGEGVATDRERRMEFAELVREARPESISIIDHIGASDLATVKKLARHARRIGLDAISSVPPFFFSYDEQGVLDYYRAMSDESEGLPLIVYAAPMAGPLLPVSTIEKMLDIPGFIGMKFTNPNYYLMSRYKKIDGGNINIFNGPDETCALGLMMGADGAIGSTYNIMPRTFVGIYNAVQAGDVREAMRLQHKADDLIEALLDYNVVEAVKVALALKGYDVGDVTPPLPRMSDAQKAALTARLCALGFPEEF
ncbi:MAG: dihydrodipicolinate synthase family protein [Candidatus Fimadaptatus sp.]